MRALVRYLDRVAARGWTATMIAALYLGILTGLALAFAFMVFAIVYLGLKLAGVR